MSSTHELQKFHTEIITKLATEKEGLLKDLSEKQQNFENVCASLRELNNQKIQISKELNENKMFSTKLKKEIEIKRKFLEGVYKIQIPYFNDEIEKDFLSINLQLNEISEVSRSINQAFQSLENENVKIPLQRLII